MEKKAIQFTVLFVVIATFCGCSREVTYGTIVKCPRCEVIVSKDIQKVRLTDKELQSPAFENLQVETEEAYCQKCGNISVSVKTGKVVTCEDCGKTLSQHVRTIAVALKNKGQYSVRHVASVCRACQGEREAAKRAAERAERLAQQPLPCTVVSTSDASFGDYGDTEGRSRTVFRVRLRVRQIPTQEQMERTAERIWQKHGGGEQESYVFLYLPGMNTEDAAYGCAEFSSSGLASFEIQDAALIGTKWEQH